MIIRELRMKNFGKFSYKNIEFGDGINIVYGANESGKSITHSFIRAMLYGLDRNQVDDSGKLLYEKFKPWEREHDYSGSMRIKTKDTMYSISRNFIEADRSFSCINETDNTTLDIKDTTEIECMRGLTIEKYMSTISSEQNRLAINRENASELKRYLTNIATSRDQDVNTLAALENLRVKKEAIINNRTINYLQELEEMIESDESEELQLQAMQNRSKQLLNEMVLDSKEKEAESIRIISEYVNSFDDIKKKYKEYQQKVDERKLMLDIDDRLDEPEKKSGALFPMIMIGLAMALIVFCLIKLGAHVVGICACIGIMFLAGSLMYLFNDRVTEWLVTRECERRLADEQYCRETRENFDTTITSLQREIMEYAKRACPLSELNNNEMFKLEQEIIVLKSQVDGYVLRQQKSEENIKLELEMVNSEIERLKGESINREKRRRDYEETVTRAEEEKKDLEAIDIAMDTIHNIVSRVQGGFNEQFAPAVSKYCNMLTDGRYKEVIVGDDLSIRLLENETYVDIEDVSAGTIGQIFLAVRLAVSDGFTDGEKLPMILDDSFVYYDDVRLGSTLKGLSMMEDRQVIIFSCQRRECDILDRENIKYTLVEL